jgi:hypothetical protein
MTMSEAQQVEANVAPTGAPDKGGIGISENIRPGILSPVTALGP